MNSNNKIWRKKKLTKLTTRVKLYETLVQSILLYNAGTWGMSKTDEKNIDSFHRRQLRQVLGIKWLHKIRSEKLPLSFEKAPRCLFHFSTFKEGGYSRWVVIRKECL